MEQHEVDKIEVTLKLNVGEVNVILASLGKHPFDEIVALHTKVKEQGVAQVKEILDLPPDTSNTQLLQE